MKKCILLAAALTLCIMIQAGCGEESQNPSRDTEKPANSTQVENNAQDLLQCRINENEAMLGVGFLGYIDSESDETAVREFAAKSAIAKVYPFLTDCAPVLFEGAELYALVPANRDTVVAVYPAEISEEGNYIDRKDAPIYIGKPGETVVLRCNLSEIYANVLISVFDGKSTLEFHPTISLENGCIVQENGCYDFSVYEKDFIETAWGRVLATDTVQDAPYSAE